jgi:ligand-binding sensor domain-containing protein/serine phosphatase RsbU (regulator of sigma subunit)
LRHIALFGLFLFLSGLGYAQEYKFKHIGKENGLSQNRVNAILGDKDGFLWFATDDGLNRYNGQSIRVYKNIPGDAKSISDNWINALYVGDDGTLYIGTEEGGLNIYNKFFDTFEYFQFDPKKENSISSNKINCIIQNDEHSLWIGTDNGLNLFDLKTKTFKRFLDEMVNPNNPQSVIKNDNIRSLLLDKQGILWIGTTKSGLQSYDAKKKIFTDHLQMNEDGEMLHPNIHRIRTLFEDSKGQLWIGFDGGSLARYAKGEFHYYLNDPDVPGTISDNQVTSIVEDHTGQMWIGTGDGISLYDPKTDAFRVIRSIEGSPFSLRDDFIRVLCEDKANSIWIGTEANGVSVFHRSIGKFKHINSTSYDAKGLEADFVFSFEEADKDHIWIGTMGGGLAVYDRKTNSFTHYYRDENNTHDNILFLKKVGKKMWFGTWGGGFSYFDLETGKFRKEPYITENSGLSNNNVIWIEPDAKGNLWLATLRGLNYYDAQKDEIRSWRTDEGLPNNTLYCLHLENNILWIGSSGGGLIRFDIRNNSFKQWLKGGKNSLSNNTVHAIVPDGKGMLWLATKNGLNKFDPRTESFTSYSEPDGLSNNFIVGILPDRSGNLWLTTYNGLTKFNPEKGEGKEKIDSRVYFAIDGLQGDEFNQNAFFKTSDGELFIGGTEGFNHFYPQDIVDNPYIPPVVITSFKVAGKEYALDSAITCTNFIQLSYKKNFFSFEFASLDYILPEKILYSYKMEGLDEEWSVPSHRNFASYTDLQGGDYVFRVKATNNDGVWNEKGVTIHIRIIPPFYKTKWFYSVVTFLTILLVFVFIRLRIASIKKEKKRLEDMVEQRTKELAEKNRDIMGSIQYAKRIQEAILPDKHSIFVHLPESFILYRPKDIVSGDFYWFGVVEDKAIIASVDCTGHGVPGAFMSMIGHNLLNQIILEKHITDPAQILSHLRQSVRRALKQEGKEVDTQDGMDLALCVLDKKTKVVQYAGAFRPMIIVRENSLEKLEGEKLPIGATKAEEKSVGEYITHERQLQVGDCIYMYSDGFVDQFGGPAGKKFMGKNLHNLMLQMHRKSMTEQHFILLEEFEKWTGNLEQVDDVLVIGIRVV